MLPHENPDRHELSPLWCEPFERAGWRAVHWSTIGDPRAPDSAVMAWAAANGCWVFTHDLDFGAILAATQARAPSVVQVRTQDVLPASLGPTVIAAIRRFDDRLREGALIVINESRARVRILPLRR